MVSLGVEGRFADLGGAGRRGRIIKSLTAVTERLGSTRSADLPRPRSKSPFHWWGRAHFILCLRMGRNIAEAPPRMQRPGFLLGVAVANVSLTPAGRPSTRVREPGPLSPRRVHVARCVATIAPSAHHVRGGAALPQPDRQAHRPCQGSSPALPQGAGSRRGTHRSRTPFAAGTCPERASAELPRIARMSPSETARSMAERRARTCFAFAFASL